MRQRYAQRQGLLREAIATRFGADWPTSTHKAGLHMVMHLPAGTDDLGISMAARTQGLSARASRYYSDTSTPQQGLLLGYACVRRGNHRPRLPQARRGDRTRAGTWRARRPRPVLGAATINREAWSGA